MQDQFFLTFLPFFRRYAGIPDFLTADDMEAMVSDSRIDPKMVFSYVQEVYRMCNEMWADLFPALSTRRHFRQIMFMRGF